MKKLLGYFFQGLLVSVPVAALCFVIYKGFILLDGILPYKDVIPGLGIITLLVGLIVIGFLANTIIARPIKKYFEKLLDRVPLVKTIYNAVRDLMSAFVGKQKKFDKPVMVKLLENSELEKLGFVTEEDLSELGIKNDKIAVYLPHSYNFSGNLYIVPRKNVTPIDASAADVMKFIVSGGVTEVEHKEVEENLEA